MTTAFWTLSFFSLLFGAIVGSFLNVVIYRVPAGESIVSPSSRCPECGESIRWYDNIPILSWLVLGGECRQCGGSIPIRYSVVEGLTALLSLALWFKVAHRHFDAAVMAANLPVTAIVVPFFLYFAIICLLIVIAFVDLDYYIIPHEFTVPGMVLGLSSPWLIEWLVPSGGMYRFWPPVTPSESVVGFLLGGGSVLAIYFIYFALRHQEGLGGGDVTLMAFVGAWLGWPSLIFIFFAASLQGIIVAAVSWLSGSDWLKPPDELYSDEEPMPDEGSEHPGTEDRAGPSGEQEPVEEPSTGSLAVPYGPFIVLASLEHFFLGPYLPRILSMGYLYDMWFW